MAGKRARGRAALRVGAGLAGLALVVVLVFQIGPAAIMAELRDVGPRLLWLVAAYTAGTALMALPWRLLLDPAVRPPLAAALASRFAASGLNALLPFVGAGEMTRLLWLPRAAWAEGAAALIIDRLVFALASACTLLAGAAAIAVVAVRPNLLVWAALACAAVLAGLAGALVALFRRGRVFGMLQRLARGASQRLRLPNGPASELPGEIDLALRRMFDSVGARRLVGALVIHLVARALMTLEIYLALLAMGARVGPAIPIALAAVPVALALVASFLPSQIGVQEGSQALVAQSLGLGPTVGVTLVLLQRIRQLAFVPLTAWLLSRRRHAPSPLPSLPQPAVDGAAPASASTPMSPR